MTAVEFLEKSGIDKGRIARRYIWVLKKLHRFVSIKKVAGNVRIDHDMLKNSVYDYFVDIVRVKEFHDIERTNTEKVCGYMGHWLLQRKPIQVLSPFPGSEFINELFVTAFIVQLMLTEKKISGEQRRENATFDKFQVLLNYYLKYRPVTQQSPELMIGAFFCGYDFQK